MCSVLVSCDTSNVLTSKPLQFETNHSKMSDKSKDLHTCVEEIEDKLVQATQAVVRGMVWPDAPGISPEFDRFRKVVEMISSKYHSELDRLVGLITVQDMESAVQSFTGILDAMFADCQFSYGRFATVLAFAGRLVKGCVKQGVISTENVDELGAVIGSRLASRVSVYIQDPGVLEEFERFCQESNTLFDRLPWKHLAYSVLGLGALAVWFSLK